LVSGPALSACSQGLRSAVEDADAAYRHVTVPAIRGGATVMEAVFGDAADPGSGDGQRPNPDLLLTMPGGFV
jgi:hypothetical protein